MTFPQFRCYSDKRSFFKISSPILLEEVKVLGSFYQVFTLNAVQLPDRNFVADLLGLTFEGVQELSEQEFLQQTEAILNSKQRLD